MEEDDDVRVSVEYSAKRKKDGYDVFPVTLKVFFVGYQLNGFAQCE